MVRKYQMLSAVKAIPGAIKNCFRAHALVIKAYFSASPAPNYSSRIIPGTNKDGGFDEWVLACSQQADLLDLRKVAAKTQRWNAYQKVDGIKHKSKRRAQGEDPAIVPAYTISREMMQQIHAKLYAVAGSSIAAYSLGSYDTVKNLLQSRPDSPVLDDQFPPEVIETIALLADAEDFNQWKNTVVTQLFILTVLELLFFSGAIVLGAAYFGIAFAALAAFLPFGGLVLGIACLVVGLALFVYIPSLMSYINKDIDAHNSLNIKEYEPNNGSAAVAGGNDDSPIPGGSQPQSVDTATSIATSPIPPNAPGSEGVIRVKAVAGDGQFPVGSEAAVSATTTTSTTTTNNAATAPQASSAVAPLPSAQPVQGWGAWAWGGVAGAATAVTTRLGFGGKEHDE